MSQLRYSSEVYEIDPADVIILEDAPARAASRVKCRDEIVVLIGNRNLLTNDKLIRGRGKVEAAVNARQPYIKVRFCFISQIAPWNLLPLFIRQLRYKYKYFNSNIYHVNPFYLRQLKIERGIRTAANAYAITKKCWAIPEQERKKKYNNLLNSLQKGFDDRYPISIMFCRRFGARDSVDNGHHRLGICIEHGITRISTNFIAAGALSPWMQKIILKINRLFN